MAFKSSSDNFSFFAFPPSIFGETLVLSEAEITSFHNVDRSLYARLALNLRRDPFVSMRVTAMWIWLERLGCHPGTLIVRINHLVDMSLHALFDEAVACLSCLTKRSFRPETETRTLHLTRAITGRDFISLKGFYTNRDDISTDIEKIMDEVCWKAFGDIIRQAMQLQVYPNPNPNWYQGQNPNNVGLGFLPNRYQGQNPNNVGLGFLPNRNANMYRTSRPVPMNPNVPYFIEGGYMDLLCSPSNSRLEIEAYRELLNNELSDLLEHMHRQGYCYVSVGESDEEEEFEEIVEEEDEEEIMEQEEEQVYYVVPADERTIFLTFSKGYPISEHEVANFFTRKYGDIYEAIRMQQKNPGEQALYARLVLHSDTLIPLVLGNKDRAKFYINGKHVWARRYVRRGGPRLPATSSNVPSPLPQYPLPYPPRRS